MEFPIPFDEARDPLVDGYARLEAQIPATGLDIGIGRGHITGLHRLEVDLRLLTQSVFDQPDEAHQRFGSMVPQIVDPVRHTRPVARGRIVEGGQHTRDDIVDIGKVALHLTMVEDRDRVTRQNFPGKDVKRHVRAAPGAIDSEKPQTGLRQAIGRRIGITHQLVRLLGSGVKGDRRVDLIFDRERKLGVTAINRG